MLGNRRKLYLTPSLNLRAIEIDGEPWFIAKDVCDVLTLSDVTMALQRLDADERAKFNLGQRGLANVNIVSESGLYALILKSHKLWTFQPQIEDGQG